MMHAEMKKEKDILIEFFFRVEERQHLRSKDRHRHFRSV